MAAVYQHKVRLVLTYGFIYLTDFLIISQLIIRSNLHTLNIQSANVESGEKDLLNDILEVGNYSSMSQSSIEHFADSWPTPRKKRRPKSENSKKKNAVKKRRL